MFCKDEIKEVYIKQKASQNMQTLFVVKVFYFGSDQFTRNTTIWEGEDPNHDDDPSGGDEVEEDPNHDDNPSDGEGGEVHNRDNPSDGEADICDIPDHDARDVAQAKWENHHRDPGQKAAQAPKQDYFLIYQQTHQPERPLLPSGSLRLPSKKNISSNSSFSPPAVKITFEHK